jgi:hypothetical protein
MRQDDYNEFLEWSREKSHYNTTWNILTFTCGFLLIYLFASGHL